MMKSEKRKRMTVLDKEVEYRPLLMIIPRKRQDKEKPLHSDYQYAPWQDEMKEDWIKLHVETGLFDSYEEGEKCLNTFLKEEKTFKEQFVFVCDDQHQLLGSAGLWKGDHFGMDRLRIHYVSVSEKAQHKGIASSMVSRLIRIYDEMPSKYPLYLATQTNSYGAIAMYSHLGFTPYLGQWKSCTKEESEQNWEIATEILREKTKK